MKIWKLKEQKNHLEEVAMRIDYAIAMETVDQYNEYRKKSLSRLAKYIKKIENRIEQQTLMSLR